MTTDSRTVAQGATNTRLAAGFFALFLGAFFVWGAGFAHSAALHDTAHDVRHAFGFPCH
ncbi:CbtB domain-containing protein [Jiella mangrovi]|uniref:CbtB-domain containing protein n=1 Tax=Jiella mangrovi TaxID=2821407 RepID=A0ABS4BKN2_9HYPH|nr:CbtB domain-containing protein [Jiella mangrovi]MBP0617297.1 CbtB-domain containing protein [Jiella mangrovi]